MRALTLLAVLAVSACGTGRAEPPQRAVARAETICRNSAVPGIPVRIGGNIQARLGELAAQQERKEVARLHELEWSELDRALDETFERALVRLDAFVRARGSPAARVAYDAELARWQARANDLGLVDCTRYGLAF